MKLNVTPKALAIVITTILIAAANVRIANAQTRVWNNANGGSYHNNANWTDIPASGSVDIFNLPSSGIVTFGQHGGASQLVVQGKSVFDLFSHTYWTEIVAVTSGGELAIYGGPLDAGNDGIVYVSGDSELTVNSGASVAAAVLAGNDEVGTVSKIEVDGGTAVFGSIVTGDESTGTTWLSVRNNGTLTSTTSTELNSLSRISLSNGIFDSAAITAEAGASVEGHGVLIGNSAGLTVASPNGAVDTSYDMNIGSRRADIFSNGPATLRGDVSLSTGGLLNSAQIVHLIGSEYTQNGGTTNIGNQFQIDNSVMYLNGGLVDTSSGIRVGMSNGSSSLLQTGGDITGSSGAHVTIGSGGYGVYNISGGTLTTQGAGELILGGTSGSTGEATQTGGAINVQELTLAAAVGSEATYVLENGTINTRNRVLVGWNGSASLVQSGGDITGNPGAHVIIGAAGNGVYNISGGTLTTQGAGELILGYSGGSTGEVRQTGGTINVEELTLAGAVGSEATYVLENGTINTRKRVLVGWNEAATYTQDGGLVNVGNQFLVDNGSTATINDGTINATDSIRVGVTAGTTSSMIQNGGLVRTDEYFVIGSNGSGTYELTGGTIEAKGVDRGLAVGSTGASVSASMTQSGGLVDVGELVVGHTSGGTNTYTISNGKIDARDRIVVGNHVVGTLTQTGGHVDSLNATIIVGNTAGADGSHYQVDGGLTETSGLWVGNYGDATFTQTGGYVDTNGVVIAREVTSTASYSLEGGRLWSSGTVSFGDGVGSFELDGGILDVNTLDVTGGSFTFTSGTLQADQILGMNLAMSDGLLDVGTLNGDLNMSGGILAPGNSPGVMTITGDYLLSGGLLDMELAGLSQGTEFDFVDINGNWTITGGDLQVSLLGGFTPTVGNSFDLFDFNSLTGTFDNLFLPTLTGSLAWDTSSLYTSGTISVLDATAVPEPSTFAFIAIGMGLFAWRRRRTQA